MGVVIDARATVRAHIGGVERVAREMAVRLPLLRPDRYRVLRPPAALAHRAGHLWEQAVLPLAARRDELLYCPANLAPLASRRNVIVIHDVAALRHPDWYGSVYARYQRALLPVLARRARRVLTVSEFSKREIVERLDVPADAVGVVPNGVDERFHAGADAGAARCALGLERPYVLAVGTRIARKNLSAVSGAARALRGSGIELVTVGSGARLHARRAGDRRCARSATCPTTSCPASTPAPSPWSCPRSTRASAFRAWRRWPAGRRWWPRIEPPSPRCAATRRCSWTPATSTRWPPQCWRRPPTSRCARSSPTAVSSAPAPSRGRAPPSSPIASWTSCSAGR